MADVNLHGVPVPEWLQKLRPGDPVEVTIRGTLADVIADCANGPQHLVMLVEYGSPHLHPPGPPLAVVVPAEAGVSIKSFVLAQATAD
jgi:hypothetical protein